jgi:aromatic-L-amino-acid decarboxylase
MNNDEFRKQAHLFADRISDYLSEIEKYRVKSGVKPGDILNRLPAIPPDHAQEFSEIVSDFEEIILPGITHWQNPSFFAYFPANSSYPSVLAEMLTAAMGVQGMIWETSPAATELEERMMDWLKIMLGLPEHFHGVIHDTASTATLTALLTAREKLTSYQINESGFDRTVYRIYCSAETHSSIEKGARIAGIGKRNVIKVKTDDRFRMEVNSLRQAIATDQKMGYKPLCIVATLGTTGSTTIDPLEDIAGVAAENKIWLHVDAAFAGTALLLEEYRWMIRGMEQADSFVFNPHKWMFTNFDCSAYFVKDKEALINTFSITPEYLRTASSGLVNDYRDWGIQLGRRFRALKLWFVIRNFGVEGLKQKIRHHISLAQDFEKKVLESEDFELVTPRTVNLVCFRFKPKDTDDVEVLNTMNERLLQAVNATGKMFISHTKLNGVYTLRMVIGQTNVTEKHVENAWKLLNECADAL